MVAKNIFTNVSPALTSGYHGADRPKQNIKQRIINFCTLPFVTDDTEMRFDGIDIHGRSPKEEHKITDRASGQI